MSRITARIFGVAQLAANLTTRGARAREAAAGALNKVAQEVFSTSQRSVPVDTGNLKGSGRLEPATASALVAMISYGGTASAYALIVHETHGTRSKFLEGPAREASARLNEEVSKAIRAVR